MFKVRKNKSSKIISGVYVQITGKNLKLMCFNTLLIKNQAEIKVQKMKYYHD